VQAAVHGCLCGKRKEGRAEIKQTEERATVTGVRKEDGVIAAGGFMIQGKSSMKETAKVNSVGAKLKTSKWPKTKLDLAGAEVREIVANNKLE